MRRCVGRRPFRWSGGGGALRRRAQPAPRSPPRRRRSRTPIRVRAKSDPGCSAPPRVSPHAPPTHPPTCPRTHTPTTARGRPPVLTPTLPTPDQVCLRFPSPRFPVSSRRFPVSSAFAAPTPSIDRPRPPKPSTDQRSAGRCFGRELAFRFFGGPRARSRRARSELPRERAQPKPPARPPRTTACQREWRGGASEPNLNPD